MEQGLDINNIYSDTDIEYRVFKVILLAGAAGLLLLVLYDYFLIGDLYIVPFEIIALTGFLSIYFVAARIESGRQHFNRLVIVLGAFIGVLLNCVWYYGGGLDLRIILLFLIAVILMNIILPSRYRVHFVTLTTANLCVLFGLDISIYGINTPEYYNKIIYTSLSYGILLWVMVYLKNQYDRVRLLMYNQNLELQQQYQNVEEKNEKIQEINNRLEEMVVYRTKHIAKQKERLLQYAFFNSHKLRAPLANIRGAVELIKMNNLTKEDLYSIIDTLDAEVKRLDNEVQEAQEVIHDEPPNT